MRRTAAMQSILWPHLFATPEMSASADSGVETCFLDEKKTASLKRVRKMRTAAGPKFQKRNAGPTETGRKARRKRAKCVGIWRRFCAPPGHMDDMCNARDRMAQQLRSTPILKMRTNSSGRLASRRHASSQLEDTMCREG